MDVVLNGAPALSADAAVHVIGQSAPASRLTTALLGSEGHTKTLVPATST
jgi:hypothetical protein